MTRRDEKILRTNPNMCSCSINDVHQVSLHPGNNFSVVSLAKTQYYSKFQSFSNSYSLAAYGNYGMVEAGEKIWQWQIKLSGQSGCSSQVFCFSADICPCIYIFYPVYKIKLYLYIHSSIRYAILIKEDVRRTGLTGVAYQIEYIFHKLLQPEAEGSGSHS